VIEFESMLLAWAIGLLIPALCTPLLAHWLRGRGQVDRPDERRIHQGEVPRGGGLMLAAGLIAGLLMIAPGDAVEGSPWIACLLMIVALSALGAIDDMHGLGVAARILAQLAIACGMLLAWDGVGVIHLGADWYWSQAWILSGLALIAILWLINLHNFMDGSDGLATQQAIVSGLAYAVIFSGNGYELEFMVASMLVAAGSGFLIWNRPRARIFLGDSGSLLIGGVIAWLALRALQTQSASLALCVLISSVFVIDATATLLARLWRGERWYTPHRSHAYQRLVDSGWSHARVLVVYAGLNLGLVLPTFALAAVYRPIDLALSLGVIVVLVIGWMRIQSVYNGE
jgi:Fuc2NAc and GlcNAc transferase